jgi:NitT/TauT family transport system substrate-binding protein
MACVLYRVCIAVVTLTVVTVSARADDHFTVGTNWLPDAERGSFYQADAAGIYRKYGLDVVVQAGGPQLNNPQLLAAGKLDAVMITSALEAFHNGVPIVAVAGIYQRNPQILMALRRSGITSFEDMRGKPIMISSLARNGYWLWLKAKYGFLVLPCDFSPSELARARAREMAVGRGQRLVPHRARTARRLERALYALWDQLPA